MEYPLMQKFLGISVSCYLKHWLLGLFEDEYWLIPIERNQWEFWESLPRKILFRQNRQFWQMSCVLSPQSSNQDQAEGRSSAQKFLLRNLGSCASHEAHSYRLQVQSSYRYETSFPRQTNLRTPIDEAVLVFGKPIQEMENPIGSSRCPYICTESCRAHRGARSCSCLILLGLFNSVNLNFSRIKLCSLSGENVLYFIIEILSYSLPLQRFVCHINRLNQSFNRISHLVLR